MFVFESFIWSIYNKDYDYDTGFDFCTLKEAERKLMENFNCVLPVSNSSNPICEDNNQSMEAVKLHDSTVGRFSSDCPNPCSSMQISFGFPSYGECERDEGEGMAKLYFKQNVQLTVDRESYSLLRYYQ